jgi:hypothetical protein
MKDGKKIAPLKKVSLKITSCGGSGDNQARPKEIDFDFVYGIATEGFTAFEKALSDKIPGDTIHLHVEPSQMHLYFEYLAGPLMDAIGAEPPFDLDIQVAAVAPVSDRELVRALVKKTESAGCGCSCGGSCGC